MEIRHAWGIEVCGTVMSDAQNAIRILCHLPRVPSCGGGCGIAGLRAKTGMVAQRLRVYSHRLSRRATSDAKNGAKNCLDGLCKRFSHSSAL